MAATLAVAFVEFFPEFIMTFLLELIGSKFAVERKKKSYKKSTFGNTNGFSVKSGEEERREKGRTNYRSRNRPKVGASSGTARVPGVTT